MNVIGFASFGKQFQAVSDSERGKTSISRVQNFTLQQQRDVRYNEVGDCFLAIMEFAAKNNLELIGSEAKALAFLMNTASVGNLWFTGTLD